jgi:hypothetical protein
LRWSNWKTWLKSNKDHCKYDNSYYDVHVDTSVIWLKKFWHFMV